MLFTLVIVQVLLALICLHDNLDVRLDRSAAINTFGCRRCLPQFLGRGLVRHDVLIQVTEDLLRPFIRLLLIAQNSGVQSHFANLRRERSALAIRREWLSFASYHLRF